MFGLSSFFKNQDEAQAFVADMLDRMDLDALKRTQTLLQQIQTDVATRITQKEKNNGGETNPQ